MYLNLEVMKLQRKNELVFIHREKMEQLLQACDLSKDTTFFNIVTGALQRAILVAFPFIIYLDYIQHTSIDLMKANGFALKSRQYVTESITDVDYADLALLANSPVQVNSLEQAAEDDGLNVNVNKTEFMCFKHLQFK